jgi:hypothetical protein
LCNEKLTHKNCRFRDAECHRDFYQMEVAGEDHGEILQAEALRGPKLRTFVPPMWFCGYSSNKYGTSLRNRGKNL